jgi:ketosteroid isomerase-like protein
MASATTLLESPDMFLAEAASQRAVTYDMGSPPWSGRSSRGGTTVGAKEDAELVRKGYEAFIAGDMEWMNEHLHENIVWHVPGSNVLSGDYRGREDVLAFFAKSVQVALPEFDMHDIVASEDHVVALVTNKWRRNDNGEEFEGHTIQVFHIENGQAIEVWTMDDDQAGFDKFLEGAKA